jgi:SulP family sulfate permease
VLAVALLSVLLNIVTAVFIGILIAAAMFMVRMSRSVVHRRYHCAAVRSNKNRDAPSMALLAQHGQRVAVFELEGPLFFGSAELLAVEVRAGIDSHTSGVVLDFRRTNDIDSTGAAVLLELHHGLQAEGRSVRFSGMQHRPGVAALMGELGVLAALPASSQFPDVDRAIEAAEDELLAGLSDAPVVSQHVPFEALDLLRGLEAGERDTVRRFLTERQFESGEIVFHEGDRGAELFVITQGHACVELRRADAAPIRLATFASGTTFGELSLLDREVRSATVVADVPLTCYVLTGDSFAALQADEPAIAIRLLVNLGRELSWRMRRANQMLHQLAG